MRRKMLFAATAVVIIAAVGFTASAQNGRCRKANKQAPCPADIETFQGGVVSMNMAAGEGQPSIVLERTDGTEVTVRVSPYRVISANDFEINTSDQMEVRAFKSLNGNDLFVAVELKNLTTGEDVTLRDENGQPVNDGKGGKGRRGGRGRCGGGR
jgi:hypothetical protein